MREFFLILHFIGLAMGLGTSFGFMFLGIAGSKMKKKEGLQFALNSLALSKMGHVGLGLLIISGVGLMIPYFDVISEYPLFLVKLGFVLLLLILIYRATMLGKAAQKGEPEKYFPKIAPIGRLSLLTGIIIVILAVLSFQ